MLTVTNESIDSWQHLHDFVHDEKINLIVNSACKNISKHSDNSACGRKMQVKLNNTNGSCSIAIQYWHIVQLVFVMMKK